MQGGNWKIPTQEGERRRSLSKRGDGWNPRKGALGGPGREKYKCSCSDGGIAHLKIIRP